MGLKYDQFVIKQLVWSLAFTVASTAYFVKCTAMHPKAPKEGAQSIYSTLLGAWVISLSLFGRGACVLFPLAFPLQQASCLKHTSPSLLIEYK